MISTFQESSCGTTEMAKSVGISQMLSSISRRMAASSSSRVFDGFFTRLFHRARTGPPPLAIRASAVLISGREPLAIRYRRRTKTAGGGPMSQRLCPDNVPTSSV
jgi:hypothetical protein